MEARTQTIGEFLEEVFPGCDIDAGLKRVQTFVGNLISTETSRSGEQHALML